MLLIITLQQTQVGDFTEGGIGYVTNYNITTDLRQ